MTFRNIYLAILYPVSLICHQPWRSQNVWGYKWQERRWGDRGRERRKRKYGFSKYTTTNHVAETARWLENGWHQHCQVCPEQPSLPFAWLTVWYMGKLGRFSCWIVKLHLHAKYPEEGALGKRRAIPVLCGIPTPLTTARCCLNSSIKQVKDTYTMIHLNRVLISLPMCFLLFTLTKALSF